MLAIVTRGECAIGLRAGTNRARGSNALERGAFNAIAQAVAWVRLSNRGRLKTEPPDPGCRGGKYKVQVVSLRPSLLSDFSLAIFRRRKIIIY